MKCTWQPPLTEHHPGLTGAGPLIAQERAAGWISGGHAPVQGWWVVAPQAVQEGKSVGMRSNRASVSTGARRSQCLQTSFRPPKERPRMAQSGSKPLFGSR